MHYYLEEDGSTEQHNNRRMENGQTIASIILDVIMKLKIRSEKVWSEFRIIRSVWDRIWWRHERKNKQGLFCAV